jgi:hypothetical protein
MPRPATRANLGAGLRLDLNRLARRGFIERGASTRGRGIRFTSSYWGEVASGEVSADMSGEWGGSFTIALDIQRPQSIHLVAKPRHFGGVQWYFVCPKTGRHVSVLYRPPGAVQFASRHAWGPRRVAYASQFLDQDNRAHHAQSKIKTWLCDDPEEWEIPPKPRGMRWRTYHRHVVRLERYGAILDGGIAELAAKLMGRFGPV